MREGGLYGLVKPAVAGALRGAAPTDRLALFSFDSHPVLRYAGRLGATPEQAAARLPAAAAGTTTDVGAVVDDMLKQLERGDAAEVAAVVLLTDGQHDPPPGSRYCTRAACDQAWRSLAERAKRLPEGRFRVYAIALRSRIVGTVRTTLERVFAKPEVVELPPGQVAEYLEGVKREVRVATARNLVRKDTAAGVDVRWSGPLTSLDLAAGRADVDLTLRSTARDLPLAISGVSVTGADGFPLRASGVPERVELPPGATQTFRVQLTWDPVRRADLGRPSASREGTLQVRGTVEPNLGEGLGALVPPGGLPLRDGAAEVRGTAATGWDRTTLAVLALLLLAGAVAAVVAWAWRNPAMDGVLTVERLAPKASTSTGYARKRLGVVSLSGRRTRLRASPGLALGAGRGLVKGVRPGRNSGPAVLIAYSPEGSRWARGGRVCRLGQLVVVRGHVFRYLPSDSPALRDAPATTSTGD
jgi:hypothetical protein